MLCSHLWEQVVKDTCVVINHLRDLGFKISWANSQREPAQSTKHLGLNIDTLLVSCYWRGDKHLANRPFPLPAGKSNSNYAYNCFA